MVVTLSVTDLVASMAGALWNLTLLLQGGWDDVLANAAGKLIVQDVAVEAVEVDGAVAAVVGGLLGDLAGASVVAGAGVAGAIGRKLALGAREAQLAHTLGALLDRDAGPAIQATQGPAAAQVVLTSGPVQTRGTLADVPMLSVAGHGTRPTIPAGLVSAAVDHRLAAAPRVALPTLALVVVDALDTVLGAALVAGVGEALVNIPLATLPHKAWQADAAIAAHPVDTLPIVEALGGEGSGVVKGAAVVYVDLTVDPLSPSWTGTFIGVDEVNASPSILTGVREALVDLL